MHVFSDEKPICIDCERTFVESELLVNFDYPVCDACKKNDEEGEYDTMIKTDAMVSLLCLCVSVCVCERVCVLTNMLETLEKCFNSCSWCN